MALTFLIAAWTFAGLSLSAICLEKTAVLPDGWKVVDEAPDPSTKMRFSIALRQPGLHSLESKILSGSRLNASEALAMRAPIQKDVNDVMHWLRNNGIETARLDEDWIRVTTTVSEANKLLDTQLRRFSFAGNPPILRTTEYTVPNELAAAVDFIHPIANFMTPEHEVSESPPLPRGSELERRDLPCSPWTTLDCISKLYGIDYVVPDNRSPIRFGIAGFLEQWASYDDLRQAFTRWRPDLVQSNYNFSVELLDGGENRQELGAAGTEANLDVQFGMTVGYPTNVIYYSVGGRGAKLDGDGKPVMGEMDDNEPYLNFLEYILQKPDNEIPQVLSVSYADDELSVPQPYATRVCDLIGLLASRGVSFLSGSGDGGARGGRNATCKSNDGSNKDMTISTFPASCPWVTSVGAVNNGQEPPSGAVFSSGGFSSYFSRPAWQREAVDGYVEALNGHLEGFYDPNMRAVPDISAIGTQFAVTVNGQTVPLQGTSASTPVVAGMIALINDARVRKGKRTLGFLNGKLYSPEVRKVLQDITSGESVSCVFSGNATPGGWPAKKGWDAITGLGVPLNFRDLLRVLDQMP